MAESAASVGSFVFWVMFAILAALSHAGYPGPRGGENCPAAVKQARNLSASQPHRTPCRQSYRPECAKETTAGRNSTNIVNRLVTMFARLPLTGSMSPE